MERQNYLYLAHSKLRECSMGPELLVGDIPSKISGRVRVLREGKELWAGTFLTGEDNMRALRNPLNQVKDNSWVTTKQL